MFLSGLVVFLCMAVADGANILLFPYAHGFNTRLEDMSTIANILADRGHSISVLINMEEGPVFQKRAPSVDLHEFPPPADVPRYLDEEYRDTMFKQSDYSWSNMLKQLAFSNKQQEAYCTQVLMMKPSTLADLRRQKFDLFIVDFLDVCSRIMKYYFNVPTIAYSSHGYSIDPVMFPLLPSLVQTPFRGQPRRRGFWERMWNSVSLWNLPLTGGSIYGSFDKLAKDHGFDLKGRSVEYAYVDALVILMCHPALDYQRPTFSNVKCMAGMNIWPSQPLSDELESFMQSAGEAGVIIISFGSIMNRIEMTKAQVLINVLSKMKQKVLFRHKGDKTGLEGHKNIRIMEWFPQNNLLAHNQTRLFVTHCGDHSALEAAFHGVPVVAVPVYLDQFDNANRLVDKAGMGKMVDYASLTELTFQKALREVLTNKTYKQNAQLTASLLRDRPLSVHDEFVYLVEYVMRHRGIPHQTAESIITMSTVEVYGLDVVGFLITVTIVAGFVALVGFYLFLKGLLKLRHMQMLKKAL